MTQIRPRDALTQHLDLIETLGEGDTLLGRYLDNVAQADHAVRRGGRVAPAVARNLTDARAYLITEPMLPLIDHRATEMSEVTQIGDDIPPPRPRGFAVLEAPFRYTEVRGHPELVHALCWGPAADQDGHTGWLIQTLNDMAREPDYFAISSMKEADNPQFRYLFGRWHGISAYWFPRRARVGAATICPTEDDIARISAEGEVAQSMRNMNRVILALWELLNETIPGATHTVERGDRALSRRLARRKLATEVTVITLRRETQPVQHSGTGTSPDHRTWVEGFPRRYWVGSGADRHQEWRNVRGHWWPSDEALPILDRPKVNRLVR